MINVVEKSKCNGCHACSQICPKQCIDMVSDTEGFWYPTVDATRCVQCGACEKACPILTPPPALEKDGPIAAYAAIYKEDSVRLASSSGGVFSALASYVLGKGGAIFGAAFDEDFRVHHQCVESTDALDALRGSKYVQSRIGNTYREAEALLKEGRLVLFSGTPCQIEGLLSYLKKSYDNLIAVDLICHGVPSPMVWQKYLEYRQTVAEGNKAKKISFRSKEGGWHKYTVSFGFDDNSQYRQTSDKDPMMQVFLKNLCLRPSCYDCAFKRKVRRSDITLADFWGIQNVLPEMDDDKGTSLLLIQSEKGRDMIHQIADALDLAAVDADVAIAFNSAMVKSPSIPKQRNAFMKEISAEHFEKIQKKHCRTPFLRKIRSFVGRCLRKIKRMLIK